VSQSFVKFWGDHLRRDRRKGGGNLPNRWVQLPTKRRSLRRKERRETTSFRSTQSDGARIMPLRKKGKSAEADRKVISRSQGHIATEAKVSRPQAISAVRRQPSSLREREGKNRACLLRWGGSLTVTFERKEDFRTRPLFGLSLVLLS